WRWSARSPSRPAGGRWGKQKEFTDVPRPVALRDPQANSSGEVPHARTGYRLARGPGRAAHRADPLPHRALQDAQEGPSLPPWPAQARRPAPAAARLPQIQGHHPVPQAHRRSRDPQVGESVRGIERCPSAVLNKRGLYPGAAPDPHRSSESDFAPAIRIQRSPDPALTNDAEQSAGTDPRERTLHMAEAITVSAKVGNQTISIDTGRLAKQSDGSVVMRSGDSMVLVTAVSQRDPKLGFDFFPLTVDYQERLSAAGRIPGSFFRREGRLTERETLISRLIDRSLRPLFPEGYQNDTQVIATVFSADPAYDTDVLALTGASFAMAVSDVPFPFQFAGVRVGRVGGQFVANPSEEERNQSDIDVIMAANRDSIFMVEGGGKEVSENDMIEALLFGQRAIEPLLKAQEQMAKAVNAEKRTFDKVPLAEGAAARVRE